MRTSFEVPRGMRDFYPEQLQDRNAIFNAWTSAALQFGFAQYDSCVVESLDLLKHKSGPEIVEQVYAFKDKSGRDLALRPELTPTLARMISARRGSLVFPLKWFAIGQCFRYERASRGRKREHYQWNLDIVGEDALSAEAEIITCALHALSILGLDENETLVHLSSRALLSDILTTTDIPIAQHPATFLALDKKGKLDDEGIIGILNEAGMNQKHIEEVFRIAAIDSLEKVSEIIGPSKESLQDISKLMSLLEAYGVRERIKFDLSIVRGLDYYTGIVFEAFDVNRKFRAVFGGGRYDRLMEDVGGSPLTAVGLGFGDVVIAELIAEKTRAATDSGKSDFAIGYMQEEQQEAAMLTTKKLRAAGKSVDLSLHPEKPKNFFSRAGNGNALRAILIGPDDISSGTIRIKHLTDRTETSEPLADYTS